MLALRSEMASLASESGFFKVPKFRAHICLRLSVQLDIPHDSLNIAWQRKFHHDSFAQTHDGSSTIAISAFFLSTLRTSLQRKSLVKEMWESGADTIVSRLIIADSHHL
jgi:hypothetical protein